MKEVKRYKCDFCKRVRANKKAIMQHEAACLRNPKSKSCSTCCWDSANEEYLNWCEYLDKEIMIKGQAIRNCVHWQDVSTPYHKDYYDYE